MVFYFTSEHGGGASDIPTHQLPYGVVLAMRVLNDPSVVTRGCGGGCDHCLCVCVVKYTLYMGRDKIENEDLIKFGWPNDVWFHVSNLSSAHVYLRMPEGMSIRQIPERQIQIQQDTPTSAGEMLRC
jgi:hypothetical protein